MSSGIKSRPMCDDTERWKCVVFTPHRYLIACTWYLCWRYTHKQHWKNTYRTTPVSRECHHREEQMVFHWTLDNLGPWSNRWPQSDPSLSYDLTRGRLLCRGYNLQKINNINNKCNNGVDDGVIGFFFFSHVSSPIITWVKYDWVDFSRYCLIYV